MLAITVKVKSFGELRYAPLTLTAMTNMLNRKLF
jgi:hypothetical protein